MRPALRITLDHDLPPRTHRLGNDVASQIFGGCVGAYQVCQNDADCCPAPTPHTGLRCTYNVRDKTYACHYFQ